MVIGDITSPTGELTKTIPWDETEASISFTANSAWEASVAEVGTRAATSISWLKLTVPNGGAGDVKMPLFLSKNDNETYREAEVTIKCGEKSVAVTIRQEANPDAVKMMDASAISNYSMYITPGTWNEGFEKGPDYMLRSDARWSWWRMKQSEHFFVFWEPGFGDNPNAESVPEALRVDIDDLLQKAEQFYKTNVEKLGMATVGQGKSVLDNHKMQIYLLYQTEWLATGSGYDDKIGALWVNPSTCKPVGSTIGHEIGHSFQYQVSADKLFTGEATPIDKADGSQLVPAGFRYGFGENGAGGCAYWEQCAQWQSFQDYPNECFDQDAHYAVWLKNHHRHFNHEFMRYASYWFQYWFTEKHGIESYARIWKESKYPEDPLQTYMRIYCNNSLDALYKDGKSHYGEMHTGKKGTATYEVPANTERLYLCVLAAPDKYNRNAWDDDETNDEQWPYRVKFLGTDLLGNVTIPEGVPTDVETSLEVSLDASSESYPLHTFNLLNDGVMEKIAKAFKLQPSEIASATLEAGVVKAEGFTGPADGKVAVGLTNSDGSVSYAYSANGIGFWIAEDGSAGVWGDGTKIYFEYDAGGYALTVGHKPGASEKGKTYTIKPTMVYNKNGKLHKAVITIKMKFA